MKLSRYVLLQQVPHRVIVELPCLAGAGVVGVDRCALARVILHELLQRVLIRGRDDLGCDLLRGPVLGSHHGGLADCPASGHFLALRFGHVLSLVA